MPPSRAVLPTWGAWVLVLATGVIANLLNNSVAPKAYLFTSLVAAAALLAIGRATGLSWRHLGLARDSWVVGLLWAASLIAVVASVYIIAAALPLTHGLFEDKRVATDNLGALLFQAAIRIPFGTVFLEEVLFRGVILALAARSVGWWRGAVVSSLLFGLWHILPARAATGSSPAVEAVAHAGGTFGVFFAVVGSVVATAAAGMVFCWLRIRSGSLFASMGLHWATNGLGYLVAYFVKG
jgi:membrane protease YdiL (CAAX protease family)